LGAPASKGVELDKQFAALLDDMDICGEKRAPMLQWTLRKKWMFIIAQSQADAGLPSPEFVYQGLVKEATPQGLQTTWQQLAKGRLSWGKRFLAAGGAEFLIRGVRKAPDDQIELYLKSVQAICDCAAGLPKVVAQPGAIEELAGGVRKHIRGTLKVVSETLIMFLVYEWSAESGLVDAAWSILRALPWPDIPAMLKNPADAEGFATFIGALFTQVDKREGEIGLARGASAARYSAVGYCGRGSAEGGGGECGSSVPRAGPGFL
jgi:hypothetical protein